MQIGWEALGVVSVIAGGILGWLLRLQSKITFLTAEIEHLKAENTGFKDFIDRLDKLEKRLIRFEERLEALTKELEGLIRDLRKG